MTSPDWKERRVPEDASFELGPAPNGFIQPGFLASLALLRFSGGDNRRVTEKVRLDGARWLGAVARALDTPVEAPDYPGRRFRVQLKISEQDPDLRDTGGVFLSIGPKPRQAEALQIENPDGAAAATRLTITKLTPGGNGLVPSLVYQYVNVNPPGTDWTLTTSDPNSTPSIIRP